jgi:hypothetical protein
MTKQQILETLNKWREHTDSIPATENQIAFIGAQSDPCLICVESMNMFTSVNSIIKDTLEAFEVKVRSGDMDLDDPGQLAGASFSVGLYNDWHKIAIECILRMANAGHKQLLAKNIKPLGGCVGIPQSPDESTLH